MQTIKIVDVKLNLPNRVPCNSTFLTAAFVGSALHLYFLVERETDITDEWVVIARDLRTETSIPDGFKFLTTVQRQPWDHETLAVFIRT